MDLTARFIIVFQILFIATLCYGQFPFEDITSDSHLSNIKKSYGIAIGDFNNDNYEDLSITFLNGPPKLFRNNRDGTYDDVTEELNMTFEGNARASAWIDINNDGWLDLFVGGKNEESKLYLNDEGQNFREISDDLGMSTMSNVFSINFMELNDDAFLDIYLSNFLQENTLLINDGNKSVRDKINYYQLWDSGKSMASIIFDYDNDGDDDLYLIHDGNQPNILYEQLEDELFVDVSEKAKVNIAAQGMGVDIGDINNDGCMDLYITNLYENNLLLNNCDGTFTDISIAAGVADYGMGWGVTFVDYDNDGLLDIFVCNDSYFSSYSNVLYQNNGDLTFSKANISNLVSKTASYGCACTDLDLDGKMDIFIANQNAKDDVQLLHNIDNNQNNWIGFYLQGDICNTQAIGSRIEVVDSEGKVHVDQVTGGNGYATQGSPLMHFGLARSSIQSIRVIWTDGMTQAIDIPDLNAYYILRQGEILQPFNKSTSVIEILDVKNLYEVYPNPSDGLLNLTIYREIKDGALLQVSDIYGRVYEVRELGGEDNNITIDLHHKNIGQQTMLYVSLLLDGEIISKKIIIQ